ncbi:MAG: SpoIID/LytB domain-containing protein [Microthrixaceae bacterium]
MSTAPSTCRSDDTRGGWCRRLVLIATVVTALAVSGVAGTVGAPAVGAQSNFTFTGGGWGHGVGMSQWGARGLAANGRNHQQILTHYYTGTAVSNHAVSNDLRVLLTERTGTVTVVTTGVTAVVDIGTVGAGATLRFTRSGSSMVVSGALNGSSTRPMDVVFFAPVNVSPPGYTYRYGRLSVRVDPAGGVRAILGELSMQEYLYGIGEMPSSWPAEALKAQATASRTFAQKRRAERTDSKDFDLYGSVMHQAYTGTRFEATAWTNAVDATAGQVVTYGGGLIDAVYSASSGGHTENSEIVWVSPVPYLKGVPDPYDADGGNPNGSWSRTYSGAQLGSWFGLGTVTDVRILGNTGTSGRVDKATVRLTGTGGTRDVPGATFRSTVNSRSPGSQLLSTKFGIGTATGSSSRQATGDFHTALADGRKVIVGGRASDPDGQPLVRVVSTMGSQRAVREMRAIDGHFLMSWTGAPGTRNVCVTVFDQPSGQAVPLGCRDIVVK